MKRNTNDIAYYCISYRNMVGNLLGMGSLIAKRQSDERTNQISHIMNEISDIKN